MTYAEAIKELQDLVDNCMSDNEPRWAETWGNVLSAIESEVSGIRKHFGVGCRYKSPKDGTCRHIGNKKPDCKVELCPLVLKELLKAVK